MASERNILKENVNDSRNTRMDLDDSAGKLDFRVDEIMFLGRYHKGAQTIQDLSKVLGRPIRVLDIGCGHMDTARTVYKAYIVKKSEILEEYIGVDIDDIMIEKSKELYKSCYEACNCKFVNQDLTVNPRLDFEDDYFDLVICTEFLEHINPKYSQAIIEEARRLLNPEGIALFSTPNSNGSPSKLPKDHFYEYSYEELLEKFNQAGWKITKTVGMAVSFNKVPKDWKEKLAPLMELYSQAWGRNSHFMRVAIAPLVPPTYCKNVLYIMKK